MESWLAKMNLSMDMESLGDDLQETLALAEKHQHFHRMVCSYEEKFKRLQEFNMVRLKHVVSFNFCSTFITGWSVAYRNPTIKARSDI